MTTGTHKITRNLKARRKALLKKYDDEDLHQLRVNIRRARALLKPLSDPHCAALRREWGLLAQQTNAARDWDTLAIYAAQVLPPRDWQSLQPLVEDYRERARQRVLTTLQSDNWEATLGHWKKLVKQMGSDAFAEGTLVGGNRQAAKRVFKSSRKALARRDERSWHKFRIAVKNLRYKLDNTSLEGDRELDDLKAIRKMCKRLQNALGDWHDTVVHHALLAEIANDPRLQNDPHASQALGGLATTIEASGRESLLRVTTILERDKEILAAAVKSS